MSPNAETASHAPRDADFLSRLESIIGAANVITAPAEMASYLTEPRDRFHSKALCVARPASTAEVATLVALCAETGTAVVPQGGNTGLVGGQVPSARGDELILSLTRMNRLREADPSSNTLIVEAGMTLAQVHAEADRADRYFPLSFASEHTCTIGGNLATNAGGVAVLAYGNARDLTLGLEVVLADGRILSDLSKLRKNNTGYDLKNLFIGSEGTLGIITAAVLKLYPKPRVFATAFAGLRDPRQALRLLDLAHAVAGNDVKTFELIPRIGIDFVLAHEANTSDPLPARHNHYVLMELASQSDGLDARMGRLLDEAKKNGIIEDASVAGSTDQRSAFWRVRERLPDSQRYEGGSIKHDVSVPVSDVPAFLTEVEAAVTRYMPGARLVAFGHLGDGNIHCNVSQPVGADKAGFLAQWDSVNEIVHAIVAAHKGSISAEHGIGQLKRKLLPGVKDPVALDLMRSLKATLDPKSILNPGKVL
ncbi:MAG: FAD-binding oxidoreductase [Beijerinckiaceae bacterium]|nr:MAG: FAD-binding oxidoreductase [Beijerinckiaceae bacterium]